MKQFIIFISFIVLGLAIAGLLLDDDGFKQQAEDLSTNANTKIEAIMTP